MDTPQYKEDHKVVEDLEKCVKEMIKMHDEVVDHETVLKEFQYLDVYQCLLFLHYF